MAAPRDRSRCRCGSSSHGGDRPPGRSAALVRRRSALRRSSRRRARGRSLRGRAARAIRRAGPLAHAPLRRRLLDDARRRSAPALSQRPGRTRRAARPQHRRAWPVGAVISIGSAIAPGSRVLQIGTGSGYFTAILAELVGLDRHRSLGLRGRRAARRGGARQSRRMAAGARCARSKAPPPIDGQWDVIVAFAGATAPPARWLDALAPGGRAADPDDGWPAVGLHAAPRPTGRRFRCALGRQCRLLPLRRRCATTPRRRHLSRALSDPAGQRHMRSLRRDPHGGTRPAGCTATAGASASTSCTDGSPPQALRLPVVRRGHDQVERPLRESCGEWNTITEEAGAAPGPAGAMMSRGQGGKKGRTARVHRPHRLDAAAAALQERHQRIRPGVRRRAGRGLGAADRRRSRHRQVDAAAADGGGAGQAEHRLRLHHRRRIASTRYGSAPCDWASPTRRSSSWPPPRCATSWRRSSGPTRPRSR